ERLAHDRHAVVERGPHARAEQVVVVHEHHGYRDRHGALRAARRRRGGRHLVAPSTVAGTVPGVAARDLPFFSVFLSPLPCRSTGIRNRTSVPHPGLLTTSAEPSRRRTRPRIDSRTPNRSCAISSRSNPSPRSRTNTSATSSVTSRYTETGGAPCLNALSSASRVAWSSADVSSVGGQSPTTTVSTVS